MILDAFLLRAALAGVGVALAAGPIGCFVVWRRMAYFGDATAHASILGVTLALATGLPLPLGVAASALAMALAIAGAAGRTLAPDTLLGVAAHGALASGLVAASFLTGVRLNLESYLFGDILAVSWADVALIWGGAAAILGLICWRWRGLVLSTLSPELACAAGLDPARERLVLTVTLALLVAIALKVVGALLITAMLIIPAAAARSPARTPEAMAALAAGAGAVAAIAGLAASLGFDTPAGPSIVVAAVILLIAAVSLARRG